MGIVLDVTMRKVEPFDSDLVVFTDTLSALELFCYFSGPMFNTLLKGLFQPDTLN
jgi:hypothetical protein